MLERHNDELGHEMILVSRTGIIVFILFSVLMTGLLMGLFMFVDFDSILGQKHLAMKVGATTVGMTDFGRIKQISGDLARKMSDQSWAEELFTTLILAEDARNNLLDQDPELKSKSEIFNSALNSDDDEDRIARAIFLNEQLAKASINKLLKDSQEYQNLLNSAPEISGEKISRLHLRTIQISDEDTLSLVFADIASGSTLEQINASYSQSLYRGVGGDLGWKNDEDLPEGVFARLQSTANGELVEGFRDESGIHLFAVISRSEKAKPVSNEKQLQQLKSRLISKHLIRLKTSIDHWINPNLRGMCQISTDTGLGLSGATN